MKKTLLILSLFSWFGTANAQEKTIQQLKRELSEHPQQDTFRVNRLLLLSLFSFQPLTERINFTEEALSISQAINYLPGQGYALANMGSFQYLQGAIIKSDSLLAQADSLAKKLENIRLRHHMELLEDKLPLENKKIALPTQKETLLVPVQNILRCESSNNYTIFYLINGLVHVISKPIYEYEEMFRSFGFIRCHQSHLVNKRHVISILNQDSGYLVLAFTDQKIPISRQRKILVKEALKS